MKFPLMTKKKKKTVMIYYYKNVGLRQKKERSAVSLGSLIINRMWSNFKWYLNVQ